MTTTQSQLRSVVIIVVTFMPGTLLMESVSQPLDNLPDQPQPQGDPGKAWFKVWQLNGFAGSEDPSYYNTHAEVSIGSFVADSTSWDDARSPVDWALRRYDFNDLAGPWVRSRMAWLVPQIDRHGGGMFRIEWGGDEPMVIPAGAIRVNPGGPLPPEGVGDGTPWIYEEYHDLATIEVEHPAPYDREFLCQVTRHKQYHLDPPTVAGTVTFKVAAGKTEPTIEFGGGAHNDLCRVTDGGHVLEMGPTSGPVFPWGIDPLHYGGPEPDPSPYVPAFDECDAKPLEIVLLQTALDTDKINVTGDPVPTGSPRFARWRNGFTEPGGQFKADWIKDDPDRVVVRIKGDIDPSAPWVNVKVTGIKGVSGRTEDEGRLELTQKATGWESEPFLFVTDTIDDEQYNGTAAADKGDHDQTRLAGFGAKISLEVQLLGQTGLTKTNAGQMYQPENTVKVELNILETNVTVTAADKAKAQQHFDQARLLYRQIGVDLVQQGAVKVITTLPAGYKSYIQQHSGQLDYSTRVDWADSNAVGQKFGDYIDSISAGTTVLKLFLIDADLRDLGEVTGHSTNPKGWATIAGDCGICELNYDDNYQGGYVAAHEICHILGAFDLIGAYSHRIMHGSIATPNGNHLDPRRFGAADEFLLPGGKFYE